MKQTIPSPAFQRFASGGSFYVNYTASQDIDMIPPSRIIDFRRSKSISAFTDEHLITFEWTAPGNDFVFGKAIEYAIECYGSINEVIFDSSILPTPDVYGTRQSVNVKIGIENEVLLCTIQAIDEVIYSIEYMTFVKRNIASYINASLFDTAANNNMHLRRA